MEEPNAEELEQSSSESDPDDDLAMLTPKQIYCNCIANGTDPAICLQNYREAIDNPTAPAPICP